MTPHHLPWHLRVHFRLVHQIGRRVDRCITRLAAGRELGLNNPGVTRITCPHRPLAGRRAVQLSDLHIEWYLPRYDRVLEQIAGLAPDWIFVTGDLLNNAAGMMPAFRFLAGLQRLAPTFVTLGNHDHHSGVPISEFCELADRHKLCLLINQATFVPLERGELCIVGLDDPSLHRADPRCIPTARPNRFTVLLAHAPNVLDLLDHRHATDLVLSGHSHGGQWRFPGITPFWLPYGCRRRANGFHVHNGHRLYVNRGLGWSSLPIRLNCPPEILVIDWTDA